MAQEPAKFDTEFAQESQWHPHWGDDPDLDIAEDISETTRIWPMVIAIAISIGLFLFSWLFPDLWARLIG